MPVSSKACQAWTLQRCFDAVDEGAGACCVKLRTFGGRRSGSGRKQPSVPRPSPMVGARCNPCGFGVVGAPATIAGGSSWRSRCPPGLQGQGQSPSGRTVRVQYPFGDGALLAPACAPVVPNRGLAAGEDLGTGGPCRTALTTTPEDQWWTRLIRLRDFFGVRTTRPRGPQTCVPSVGGHTRGFAGRSTAFLVS